MALPKKKRVPKAPPPKKRQLDLGVDDVHVPGAVGRKRRQLHIRADIAQGGSLHVRHMSDRLCRIGAIELDAAIEFADSGKSKPVWTQLAKCGTFRGHPAGPFELSPQIFSEIVGNFVSTKNRKIPIDFEHASEADPTKGTIPTEGAPAQGWITDLDNRGEQGLWGLVEWLEPASSYIREGKYKFFSPAIRFASKDRVTGKPIGARMTSGALTNEPFLDGLKPLAASDKQDDGLLSQETVVSLSAFAHSSNEYMPPLRRALGMHELSLPSECMTSCDRLMSLYGMAGNDPGATVHGVNLSSYLPALRDAVQAPLGSTWDQVFEAVQSLIQAAIDETEPDQDDETMDDDGADMSASDHTNDEPAGMAESTNQETTAMSTETESKEAKDAAAKLLSENETLKVSLSESAKKIEKLEADAVLLSNKIEKQEEAELKAYVADTLATYGDKLPSSDEAALLKLCKAAPDTFKSMFPRVTPAEQHLMRNLTDKRVDQKLNPNSPAAQVAAIRGNATGKVPSIRELTEKYTKEGNDIGQATNMAFKEHQKHIALNRA